MKRWSVTIAALVVGALAGSYLVGPLLHGQQAAAPPALPKEMTSYRDIVKRVMPAVVSIDTQGKITRTKANVRPPIKNPFGDDPRIPEEFRRFFEEFKRAPFDMDETPRHGFGSGFLISADGVILTNYHVVADAEQVTVTTHDGRKFTSRDIRGDRRTDLAIVRLKDVKDMPYLELGDSDAMEIGDRVLAVGAPFGLAGSVTHGIVSAKGRNGLQMNMYEDFIQTDAAINPGNSGGPLVSLDGKVIGINAAIKSRSGGFQGVGLAVASNLAKNVSRALIKDGTVRRGYLGVQIRELAPDVAERLGLKDKKGIVVAEVFENTPAGKAGLKPGDIVTEIAGKKVKDGRSLQNVVAELPVNQAAPVVVLRDGKTHNLSVTIEAQPDDFGTAQVPAPRRPSNDGDAITLDKFGIDVADLTEAMADDRGYRKGTRGVVVTRVHPGSVAGNGGLSRGMIITKVDGKAVADASAARQALEKASLANGVLLQVQSPQGGTTFVLLRQGRQ